MNLRQGDVAQNHSDTNQNRAVVIYSAVTWCSLRLLVKPITLFKLVFTGVHSGERVFGRCFPHLPFCSCLLMRVAGVHRINRSVFSPIVPLVLLIWWHFSLVSLSVYSLLIVSMELSGNEQCHTQDNGSRSEITKWRMCFPDLWCIDLH